MNARQSEALMDVLRARYPIEAAPTPSPALAARLDAGAIRLVPGAESGRAGSSAAVVPARRPRFRLVAAALVAVFVLVGGLASAGALPRSIQHRVATLASAVGIDLPDGSGARSSPNPNRPAHPTSPRGGDGGGAGSSATTSGVGNGGPTSGPRGAGSSQLTVPGAATSPKGRAPGSATSGSGSSATAPAGSGSASTGTGSTGAGSTGTGTGGLSGSGSSPAPVTLPPVTLPPVSLPPITLPPVTLPGLPPITLPPITLPPISLPPISLPFVASGVAS